MAKKSQRIRGIKEEGEAGHYAALLEIPQEVLSEFL